MATFSTRLHSHCVPAERPFPSNRPHLLPIGRQQQDTRWTSSSGSNKRRSAIVVAAAAQRGTKRPPLDGVCDQLNETLAKSCLDWAPARRKLRDAFRDIQMNLDHFLFKMAPEGIVTKENYQTNSKGVEIFWKSWLPKPDVSPKAALFFCHGYGDTCTFFFEGVARRIAASGFAVYAMDYPGFGLSYGLHGYIPSFDGMVDHVIEQYTHIRSMREVKDLPHFLMGQSMGGAVALKVHLKQPTNWDGLLLVAPMCKISEDVTPPRPVLRMLALMSCLLPEAKLFPQKDIGHLSFREGSKRKIAQFNVISYSDQMRLRTAVELIKATEDIEFQLDKVSCPLLILHGVADKVTDPQVSLFLHNKANAKDKTLKLYPDCFHSILEGEPDDIISTAINDIISWLNSHYSTSGELISHPF